MDNFEEYLENSIKVNEGVVKDAMLYSLMAGGKRLRPQLLLSILNGYGVDEKKGYRAACSLEMIHTYSLIHDDLPSMDNDDLRRGKETCHIRYGEANALLAGDALLTYAFENIADKSYVYCLNDLVKILANCAGDAGMIYGQELDIALEDKIVDIQVLNNIHYYKTGKLFIAALKMGAAIANKSSDYEKLEKIGGLLGLAFQYQDDILDVTKTKEELGKSNSDIENDKVTSVSILGLSQATDLMNEYYDKILVMIKELDGNFELFENIVRKMMNRDK